MKIGINTLFLIPGEVGGSEVYFRETFSAMLALNVGHNYVLFTNNENHESFAALTERYPSVSTVRVPCNATNRTSRILREQFQMPGLIKRSKVDVLWSPGQVAVLNACVPQAVTAFDLQYKHYPEDFGALARIATDYLLRRSVRRCERVLTISEFSKSELVKYMGLSPDKITATLLAADTSFRAQSDVCCPVDSAYILTVANSYPHKNLDRLVQGFGSIIHEIPHKLVIVGKARRGEAALQSSIRSLEDPERVSRRSGLSKEDLVAIYKGCSLFAFPSLYEGFGLPVLEAMQAGVPVLTSNCGSLAEVAGEHAEIVDPQDSAAIGNGMLNILKMTTEQRDQRLNQARDWADTFSWEHTARQTLSILESLGKDIDSGDGRL